MNFGFNSNVSAGDVLYHVQTEDRGADHPYIDTVVYQGGRVVHKRSTSYKDLLPHAGDTNALAEVVRMRLSHQHKEVIAQVESGELNLALPVPPATPENLWATELLPGLTVQLSNPATWLSADGVSLQIKVLCGKAAAGGAEVEAFFESDGSRSKPCRGKANAEGAAEMKFPVPESLAEGTSLVIRATLDEDRGELRFRLKPSKSGPVPTTPVA